MGLKGDHWCSEDQRATPQVPGWTGVVWPHAQGCTEFPATARPWGRSGATSPRSLQREQGPAGTLISSLQSWERISDVLKPSRLWDLVGGPRKRIHLRLLVPQWGYLGACPLVTLRASNRTQLPLPRGWPAHRCILCCLFSFLLHFASWDHLPDKLLHAQILVLGQMPSKPEVAWWRGA